MYTVLEFMALSGYYLEILALIWIKKNRAKQLEDNQSALQSLKDAGSYHCLKGCNKSKRSDRMGLTES